MGLYYDSKAWAPASTLWHLWCLLTLAVKYFYITIHYDEPI